MEDASLERLASSLRLFKRPPIQKIVRAPWKYIYAKALETAAIRLGKGVPTRAMLFSGDEMTVVFPEDVAIALRRYGFYEEGLTRMVLEYLKPGMIFVDIGAHLGYYTLLGSRIVGGHGQVHSFEPAPATFDVLRSNVKGNPNVHLNQAAVSSKSGTVTLNDYGARFAGHNSMHPGRFDGDELERIRVRRYEVQATSLDDYVSRNSLTPSFVKIDAESAESEILRGMAVTLKEIRPIVTIEVGDKSITGVPPSKELVAYLSQRGYQAYEFSNSKITKHIPKDRYDWDNLLFLPQ